MRIGKLSEVTGVSTRSLRYYEEQGLLSSDRLSNGYRDYSEKAVRQVALIQDLYGAGIPSDVIREIISCAASSSGDGRHTRLMGRVLKIRADLADQERQVAQRRERLEHYLSVLSLQRIS